MGSAIKMDISLKYWHIFCAPRGILDITSLYLIIMVKVPFNGHFKIKVCLGQMYTRWPKKIGQFKNNENEIYYDCMFYKQSKHEHKYTDLVMEYKTTQISSSDIYTGINILKKNCAITRHNIIDTVIAAT